MPPIIRSGGIKYYVERRNNGIVTFTLTSVITFYAATALRSILIHVKIAQPITHVGFVSGRGRWGTG